MGVRNKKNFSMKKAVSHFRVVGQKENRKFSFLITDPYFITYRALLLTEWQKKSCPHMALASGGLVKLQRRNTESNVTGLHSPKKHNG